MSLAGCRPSSLSRSTRRLHLHSDERLAVDPHSQAGFAATGGRVQNEAFCLTLARRMKIPTPSVTTGKPANELICWSTATTEPRQGRWRRLHQEDYVRHSGSRLPRSTK